MPNPTEPDESIVDVAGYPTVVRRAGRGRPLLFLHGAFFPTAWTPVHDALAEHADVIAPLHPGYAEGAPPDWLRGFDDLVLHTRGLLDALGVDAADVVGYDLGGWLAAQFATFYPERVQTLSLIAATGLWMPEAPIMEFLAIDLRRVADALFNGQSDGPGGEWAERLVDQRDIDRFVEAYGENGVTARLIWERRYDVGLARRVGALTMPSLVITPDDDRIVPVAHAQRWAELLPNSRLATIADAGHGLVIQQPDRVAAEIHALCAAEHASAAPNAERAHEVTA